LPETNATPFYVAPDGRKHKALKRRRAYQRNAAKWSTWRQECASGRVLAARSTEGRARPYELGDVAYALRAVLSRRAIDALAWVLAAERGFAGRRGVVVQHSDLATMLGCCPKSAGDAMRELVAIGLVEQRPHFVPGGGGVPKARDGRSPLKARWHERTPAYATTPRCRDVVAKRDVRLYKKRRSLLVGKTYQPTESTANPPGSQNKGTSRNRPEQRFVAELLASVTAPRVAPTAVVYDRTGGVEIRDGVRVPTTNGGRSRTELEALKLLRSGHGEFSRSERKLRESAGDASMDPDVLGAWKSFLETRGDAS
jgi:hypothetical protein